jgi:hypothetical protein
MKRELFIIPIFKDYIFLSDHIFEDTGHSLEAFATSRRKQEYTFRVKPPDSQQNCSL